MVMKQGDRMAQTDTQKTENVWSRCGKTFTAHELREQEKNCKGTENQAKEDKTKTDMLIEDRFEATDN
jgi:hypothetical protein